MHIYLYIQPESYPPLPPPNLIPTPDPLPTLHAYMCSYIYICTYTYTYICMYMLFIHEFSCYTYIYMHTNQSLQPNTVTSHRPEAREEVFSAAWSEPRYANVPNELASKSFGTLLSPTWTPKVSKRMAFWDISRGYHFTHYSIGVQVVAPVA